MYVHSNIKYLRNKGKQSQEVWGKQFNLSRGMVDSYERQRANPDADTVQAICRHYGISIEAIYNVNFNTNPGAALGEKVDPPQTEILKAKDEVIKTQAKMIEILQSQIIMLSKKTVE